MNKLRSSIKVRLLFVPMFLVVLTIITIGIITSSITRESLLNEVKNHGYATSIDFIDRLETDDANLETIQARLERITSSQDVAYAVLIDKNLDVIAHSDKTRIGVKSDDENTKRAISEGIPHAEQWYYASENITVFDIIYPVDIKGERVGALSMGYSMVSTQAAIAKNIKVLLITGIVSCLVLGLSLFTTSNYTITTINKLKEQMAVMATGDFTFPVPEKLLSQADEFGQIARAVLDMQKSVSGTIRGVLNASEQLAASSQELTATSHQSAVAGDEVAKVIEEIAHGAADQAKETIRGAASALELGELVKQNKADLKNLNITTDKAHLITDEGIEILQELNHSTDLNNQSAREIQHVIIETNESANKIARASEMIQNIADQTNLLALNASIEAARAGEAGRGFSVVADEIKKLATQSNEFTKEINTVINELTDKTSRAVQTMEHTSSIVATQSESVTLTTNKFEGISDVIAEVERFIEQVNESSNQMDDKKDDLTAAMERLSAISEENAAGSEEASASVEEQSVTVEEISNSSEALAKLAEDLNLQIAQFTI